MAGLSTLPPSPIFGSPAAGKRPERFLFVCFFDPAGINAPAEHVSVMQALSVFNFEPLNLFRYLSSPLQLDARVDLRRFDGVIIHNTVSYHPDNLEVLDSALSVGLRGYDGVKVILKQDEQVLASRVAAFIGDRGFDLVLTCLSPDMVPRIYPQSVVGAPRFMRTQTGYVTPRLRALASRFRPDSERSVDIFYRGSIQPLWFGRLAYEKRQIGYVVEPRARARGLRVDISSRREDRILGDAWLDALGSVKSTLGVESGASIMDLDGSIEALCRREEARLPGSDEDPERCEAILAALKPYENLYSYRALSPRHLEAAATRTAQIMYEDSFSGAFVAGRHYFALRRDLGNFDQAVDLIRDPKARMEMADCAHEEIFLNPRFAMETFSEQLDQQLEDLCRTKGRVAQPLARSAAGDARHVLLLCAHRPERDPRISWIADNAPPGIVVHVLGVDSEGSAAVSKSGGGTELVAPRKLIGSGPYLGLSAGLRSGGGGFDVLALMQALQNCDDRELEQYLGATFHGSSSILRYHFIYFLGTNSALIDQGLRYDRLHAIVAADLACLPAGVALKEAHGVPLVYDAHEFWPHGIDGFEAWENEFWKQIESKLVRSADKAYVVSPQLAELMSALYGKPFDALPNCEPLRAAEVNGAAKYRPTSIPVDACVFLYQGGFVGGRGLAQLLEGWCEVDSRAVLVMRGPEGAYLEEMRLLAVSLGLLGRRVFFLPSILESELVAAAAAADVGVIPYERSSINNRYCCPNKLSQYMAAGLPILHNKLDFVGDMVRRAGCGLGYDSSVRSTFVSVVNRLASDGHLRDEMGRKARAFFRSDFHWERVSAGFYTELARLAGTVPAAAGTCEVWGPREADPRYSMEVTGVEVNGAIERSSNRPFRRRLFIAIRALWRILPIELRHRFWLVAGRRK